VVTLILNAVHPKQNRSHYIIMIDSSQIHPLVYFYSKYNERSHWMWRFRSDDTKVDDKNRVARETSVLACETIVPENST